MHSPAPDLTHTAISTASGIHRSADTLIHTCSHTGAGLQKYSLMITSVWTKLYLHDPKLTEALGNSTGKLTILLLANAT